MEKYGQKILIAFVALAALITAAHQYLSGSFAASAAPFIVVFIAALAAKFYTRQCLEREIHPLVWLLTAPLYFALVGFAVWAGCVLGAYMLNNMVEAAPKVTFLDVLSGIMSRGMDFAMVGLMVGLFWALPTTIILVAWKTASEPETEFATPKLFHHKFSKNPAMQEAA